MNRRRFIVIFDKWVFCSNVGLDNHTLNKPKFTMTSGNKIEGTARKDSSIWPALIPAIFFLLFSISTALPGFDPFFAYYVVMLGQVVLGVMLLFVPQLMVRAIGAFSFSPEAKAFTLHAHLEFLRVGIFCLASCFALVRGLPCTVPCPVVEQRFTTGLCSGAWFATIATHY